MTPIAASRPFLPRTRIGSRTHNPARAAPGCTHAGSLQMTCFYREGQLHAMLEAPARPTRPRPDPFIVWSCTRINPTVSACGGAEGPEEGGLVSRLVLDSVFSFLIFTANYI